MQARDRLTEPPVSPNWLAALRAYLLTAAAANILWETAQLPLYGISGQSLEYYIDYTMV